MAVDMRVPYQQLKQHVAAGPSGMRNEYLRCLVGEYAPASGHVAVLAMSEVASMYLQGHLPGWFNRIFASTWLVAHVKKLGEGGGPDVRHVAVGEAERRAAERAVVDNMNKAYVSVLAPSQLRVGISARDFVLIHGVHLIAEKLGPRVRRHVGGHKRGGALQRRRWIFGGPAGARLAGPSRLPHASIKASVGLEVRFDKMQAYIADMEAARHEALSDIEWAHGNPVLNETLGSPRYVQTYMRGNAEELQEEVDASLSKLLSAKPGRRYTLAMHHHVWALLKHCMHHMAGYWLRNCMLPSEVKAFAEAVDATVLTAVERLLGVSFDPSTYGSDTNPVVANFLAELLHDDHDPMAILESVLGRGNFNATSPARRYDHFLNDARGPASYAAAVREVWGRLLAATGGHLGDAGARVMEREAEAASGSQKELMARPTFLDHANNSRLQNEVCALPVTCSRERILFNQLDAASGMWTVAIPTAWMGMTPHERREVAASKAINSSATPLLDGSPRGHRAQQQLLVANWARPAQGRAALDGGMNTPRPPRNMWAEFRNHGGLTIASDTVPREEAEALFRKVETLKAELSTAEDRLLVVEDELEAHREFVQRLSEETIRAEGVCIREREAHTVALADAEARAASAEGEVKNLSAKLETLETAETELRSRLRAAEADGERLRAEVEAAGTKIAALEGELTGAKAQLVDQARLQEELSAALKGKEVAEEGRSNMASTLQELKLVVGKEREEAESLMKKLKETEAVLATREAAADAKEVGLTIQKQDLESTKAALQRDREALDNRDLAMDEREAAIRATEAAAAKLRADAEANAAEAAREAEEARKLMDASVARASAAAAAEAELGARQKAVTAEAAASTKAAAAAEKARKDTAARERALAVREMGLERAAAEAEENRRAAAAAVEAQRTAAAAARAAAAAEAEEAAAARAAAEEGVAAAAAKEAEVKAQLASLMELQVELGREKARLEAKEKSLAASEEEVAAAAEACTQREQALQRREAELKEAPTEPPAAQAQPKPKRASAKRRSTVATPAPAQPAPAPSPAAQGATSVDTEAPTPADPPQGSQRRSTRLQSQATSGAVAGGEGGEEEIGSAPAPKKRNSRASTKSNATTEKPTARKRARSSKVATEAADGEDPPSQDDVGTSSRGRPRRSSAKSLALRRLE
eukprot:jgi/Tetstr1/437533/TSEL_026205.t1